MVRVLCHSFCFKKMSRCFPNSPPISIPQCFNIHFLVIYCHVEGQLLEGGSQPATTFQHFDNRRLNVTADLRIFEPGLEKRKVRADSCTRFDVHEMCHSKALRFTMFKLLCNLAKATCI